MEEPIQSSSFVNRYKDLSPRANDVQLLRQRIAHQKKMEYLDRLEFMKQNQEFLGEDYMNNLNKEDQEYFEF